MEEDNESANALESLRWKVYEECMTYNFDTHSNEAREELLRTLQTNDCYAVVSTASHGDDLATAFVRTGQKTHMDCLQAFIGHGIDVDIKDQYNNTALLRASMNGKKEAVRLLLDHDANTDTDDNGGWTPLLYSCQYGFVDIVEWLLQKNANPNLQSNFGETPLMLASTAGRQEIVQLLLTFNADINMTNQNGKTAFDCAKNEKIKTLLQNHVTSEYILK